MLRRYIEAKRKKRFENMERQLSGLPDAELKDWYVHADTQRLIGEYCKYEAKLLRAIEEELNRRGFEYQTDY